MQTQRDGWDASQSGHVIYLWMHKAKRINCIMHRGQNSTCSGELLLLVSTFAIRGEILGAGERGKVIITQKCVHKVCYFIIIFLCWTGEDSPNIEATVILISSSSSNWFQAIHPSTHPSRRFKMHFQNQLTNKS